jgi:uncharacterized protein YlxP (DUF503 family)
MVVAVLTVDLYIHGASSLKDKRTVIRGIKDRIGKKFNVSIAELDFQDKWQRAQLGIAQVGNDFNYIEKNMNTIFKILDSNGLTEVIEHSLEFL